MTIRRSLSRLPAHTREVYRRARGSGEGRREGDFRPSVRADAQAPELILSPHCDDAVLDCWGVLSGDREVVVVNLFAGVPPPGQAGVWEAVIGARDSAERSRERMAEDARALARVGRTALNLSLLDAQFRRRAGPTIGLDTLDRALLEKVQSASQVYAPAGIGSHADHLLTRRYARALLRAGMPVTLYAELPYCTFHGWPSWVDGRDPAPNRDVDAYWRSCLQGVPEMPPLRSAEITRLDGPAAVAKGEAVRCYETSLNYGVRCLMADPAFGGFEVRWRLAGTG